jgi:hypothetical protein
MNENESISRIEERAKQGQAADYLRIKAIGPRSSLSSSSRAFLWFGCAVVALAINQQCTSREWAKYARENEKPTLVYIDPTGNAYLVQEPKSTAPLVSEEAIYHHVTRLCEMQFEVDTDKAAKETANLVDYFYEDEAIRFLNRTADNPEILGSSAEKAAIISNGKRREIEIRSIRLPDVADLPSGAQKIHAEVLLYARTYNRSSDEPELRRAYRVDWYFVVLGEIKGKNAAARAQFKRVNPLRIRVQNFKFVEENVGAIPPLAENKGPLPGPQAVAMSPQGVIRRPAAADTGGPVGPLEQTMPTPTPQR